METTDHSFVPSGADGFPHGLKTIGPYRLERVIGDGGMARVYLAHDDKMGRQIAVKVLRRGIGESPEFRLRFEQEIDLLASLSIEGVVDIYDRGEEGGWAWYAMPYINGTNLKQTLQEQILPLHKRLAMAARIARALSCLHCRGVAHRDLKPENILVSDEGLTFLIDFGISKQLTPSEPLSFTRGRRSPGTPLYMAPEQLLEEAELQDEKTSDVYALGLLVYEILTGTYPFGSKSASLPQHINRLTKHEITSPATLNNALPPDLCKIILGTLKKDPKCRLPASELSEALSTALHESEFVRRSGVHEIPPASSAVEQKVARPPGRGTATHVQPKVRSWLLITLAVVCFIYGLYHYRMEKNARLPILTVSLYLDGQKVEAAELLVNRESFPSDRSIMLERGRSFAIEGIYERDGVAYHSSPEVINANWWGSYHLRLDLHSENRLEPGRDWRVPEVGMPFKWVDSLGMWVGTFEVTNSDYRRMVPDHSSGEGLDADRQPVVELTFEDMLAFANWLTQRERQAARLPDEWFYRLPTCSEWSQMALTGHQKRYPWGYSLPPTFGNYHDQTAERETQVKGIDYYDDGYVLTCPVEASGVNSWGLSGIGGNVFEACSSDTSSDVFGAWRGGSFQYGSAEGLRIDFQGQIGGRSNQGGFRLVIAPAVRTGDDVIPDAE